MKNTRKMIVGLVAAAGLAAGAAISYAEPVGYGPGSGNCFYGGPGPGAMGHGGWGAHMGFGPGMRGGYHRGGMGPGMMGYGGGPRGGFGPGAAGGWGGPANIDARLAAMKAELKITTAQEPAWGAYEKQARQQAATMQSHFAQADAQSAPERLKQRADFAKQRAANIEAMSGAVENLYAVLTPEQQSVADRFIGGVRLSQYGPRGSRRWR